MSSTSFQSVPGTGGSAIRARRPSAIHRSAAIRAADRDRTELGMLDKRDHRRPAAAFGMPHPGS
ncbi:MAG TPA: hypothetical protein VHG31_06570 [Stellaceae bacterium]|nr:hypothetical protein [Stellaceae bacterium]